MKIPAPAYAVLKGEDFIKDVAEESLRSRRIMWGQSMEYEPGRLTDVFSEAFTRAAERGLDAKLNIDYYSLHVTDGMFNYFPLFRDEKTRERKKRLITKIQAIHNLRDRNVDVQILNKPDFFERLIPTKGRNHIKLVIVDHAAWVGGINFRDINFQLYDFMVKFADPHIISFLKQLFLHMHDGEKLMDMTARFGDDMRILIDGGAPGKSIILDEVTQKVRHADKSIRFTSPFYPDGKMLNALHEAHLRGVKVSVVTPAIEHAEGLAKILNSASRVVMKLGNRQVPMYIKDKDMHSKLIIIDSKEAIFGSHNFTNKGVRMGTVEIAVETTNKTLTQNLLDYFRDLQQS